MLHWRTMFAKYAHSKKNKDFYWKTNKNFFNRLAVKVWLGNGVKSCFSRLNWNCCSALIAAIIAPSRPQFFPHLSHQMEWWENMIKKMDKTINIDVPLIAHWYPGMQGSLIDDKAMFLIRGRWPKNPKSCFQTKSFWPSSEWPFTSG